MGLPHCWNLIYLFQSVPLELRGIVVSMVIISHLVTCLYVHVYITDLSQNDDTNLKSKSSLLVLRWMSNLH